MLTLYRLDGPHKAYWQTWQDASGEHIVHWGTLGTPGDSRALRPLHPNRDPLALQVELDAQRAAGFVEIDADEMHRLRVQGRPALDDEHRQRAWHELGRQLGDTGLGHCEPLAPAAAGAEATTLYCRVVDVPLARQGIAQALGAWFEGGLHCEAVDDDGRVVAA